jgi:hypothetical protein
MVGAVAAQYYKVGAADGDEPSGVTRDDTRLARRDLESADRRRHG